MGKQPKKPKSKTTNQPPIETESTREAKKACTMPTPEKIKANREEMNKGADIAVDTMSIESDNDDMKSAAWMPWENQSKAKAIKNEARLPNSKSNIKKYVERIWATKSLLLGIRDS